MDSIHLYTASSGTLEVSATRVEAPGQKSVTMAWVAKVYPERVRVELE